MLYTLDIVRPMDGTLPLVITIDGPAGAGKSTLGELLAKQLGYMYFDTGVMYRALTLAAIEQQADADDEAGLAQLARDTSIAVAPANVADGRQYTVHVNAKDRTWDLRNSAVEQHVSAISRHPQVRAVMRERQREIGQAGRVVMVGRDIGSVVMPDAPLKIYLEASIDERARRRTAELQARGHDADLAAIRAEVARRDALDRHVMVAAPDAFVIDCDALSPEDEIELITAHLQQRGASARRS